MKKTSLQIHQSHEVQYQSRRDTIFSIQLAGNND